VSKKRIPELKIELVNGRGALLYLSLIEYKRENYICVIDNIRQSEIDAYVLDYADQSNIDLKNFLQVVTLWFYAKSDTHPLSVEIAKHGLTEWAAPIYRTFDSTYVSRIVGHGFSFDAMTKSKVKRRRVVPLPEGIEVVLKKDGRKLKPGQLVPE
jgi:hypothetical protein